MKYLQLIGALIGTLFIIILGELLRDDVTMGLIVISIVLVISVVIPVVIAHISKKIPKKVRDEEAVRAATVNIMGFVAEAIVFGAYAGKRLLGGEYMAVLTATFIAGAVQASIIVLATVLLTKGR